MELRGKAHERAMRAMGDAAQGMFDIAVLSRADVPAIMDAVKSGDFRAATIARSLSGWFDSAFVGEPPLCLTCDHEFAGPNEPAAFVVAVAANAGGIVSGVCESCVLKLGRDGILSRASELLNRQPLGACYKMAAERLMKLGPGRDVQLVHGVVEWPHAGRHHGWLQWPDGKVWDNTPPDGFDASAGANPGRMWSADEWQAQCRPTIWATYRLGEAKRRHREAGHWGPWDIPSQK